jgi:hypothetical protein
MNDLFLILASLLFCPRLSRDRLDTKKVTKKSQGSIQILRFCCHFRRVRNQTRPSCVGTFSAASNDAKSGFE